MTTRNLSRALVTITWTRTFLAGSLAGTKVPMSIRASDPQLAARQARNAGQERKDFTGNLCRDDDFSISPMA